MIKKWSQKKKGSLKRKTEPGSRSNITMDNQTIKRILGIDWGEKRIGVAVSDPLFLTAQPLTTIQCSDFAGILEQLRLLIEEKNVEKIVIGLPKMLSGVEKEIAQNVLEFARNLRENLEHIEVITWDERFTTVQAEKILIEAGMRREKRKKKIDQLSATIMLQSYIDYVNIRSSSKHEIKE